MPNTSTMTGAATKRPNDDPSYMPFLRGVAETFAGRALSAALFTVDTKALWDTYLGAFGDAERQTYNCHACRAFVERYGGLVTINDAGTLSSALWDPMLTPSAFASVAAALMDAVERRPVVGVFASDAPTLGTPATGPWSHLAVTLPVARLHRDLLKTPAQRAATTREDHHTVARALAEFSADALREAVRVLESEALSRAERFLGPVRWLLALHEARDAAGDPRRRDALLWRAVATAPTGYCHPRASVIGPLLEDILAGQPFDVIRARWSAMLHPLQYQRPSAAPAAGAIAEAEKIVATLGLERSFARRFARLDECETRWTPARPASTPPVAGGMFAHLTPKGAKGAAVEPLALPAQTMTWEKFARAALPVAERIELRVPGVGPFLALVTAADLDAPPIVRWDHAERRNPVTWYVYVNGSHAARWGLTPSAWHPVTAVVPLPNLWGPTPSPQFGEGVVLTLDGATDSEHTGVALFPALLRPELHAVRAVVEAFSARGTIATPETASACGYDVRKGRRIDCTLRVTVAGRASQYHIDRWD